MVPLLGLMVVPILCQFFMQIHTNRYKYIQIQQRDLDRAGWIALISQLIFSLDKKISAGGGSFLIPFEFKEAALPRHS